jgi:hypothetical protein
VRLPLPDGLLVDRDGLFIDNSPAAASDIDALCGLGLALGAIEPDGNRLVKLRARISPGTKSIVITPAIDAPLAAIVGAKSMRLERANRSSAIPAKPPAPPVTAPTLLPKRPPQPEQPFYELDDDESVAYSALGGIIDLSEPQIEILSRVDVGTISPPARNATRPAGRAAVTIVELPAPAAPPAISLGDGILTRSPLDIASLAFVRRLAGEGQRWGLLAHFLVANAFACTLSREFAESLAKQNTTLQRALLLRQLKKNAPLAEFHVPHNVAWQPLHDRIAPLTSADVNTNAMRHVLYRIVDAHQLEALAALCTEHGATDFVRARRLTLRLFPYSLSGVANPSQRAGIEGLLAAYVDNFDEALNRLLIRAKLDRTTKILEHAEPELDSKATALLDALGVVAET